MPWASATTSVGSERALSSAVVNLPRQAAESPAEALGVEGSAHVAAMGAASVVGKAASSAVAAAGLAAAGSCAVAAATAATVLVALGLEAQQ